MHKCKTTYRYCYFGLYQIAGIIELNRQVVQNMVKRITISALFDMKNKKGSRNAIEIRHVKKLEREIIAAHKNVAINLISIKFNVKPTKMDREILCL